MDCEQRECPVQRLTLCVEGMPREEALKFAPEFIARTGTTYKVAYVIAGFKGD